MSANKSEPLTQLKDRLSKRYQTIDGRVLRFILQGGLTWLRTNREIVNALNVFPVPDGDTGTNMTLTMQAAWDEISESADLSVEKVAHSLSHGALMGARGNSGVILSQLWRGFARALDGATVIDSEGFVDALKEARDTAYRGVVQPVEGTILTVSKDIANAADAAYQNGSRSTFDIMEVVVEAAHDSVENTPNLLPVLKDAGVVDAGGKGLHLILEGMLRKVYGLPLDQVESSIVPLSELALESTMEVIEPGQDWEVIVDFTPFQDLELKEFYSHLETLGTSIQVGEGEGMYRMHIHVPDQTEFEPIEYIKSLGTVTNVAIENLMNQLDSTASDSAPDLILNAIEPGEVAVIVVSPGDGLTNVFASLGAAAIIEGGQTMNPSTEMILKSIENLPTDQVIVLPNNKNIVLAAEQAVELTVKDVSVVRTVNIPQGISAMLCLNPDASKDDLIRSMENAKSEIIAGEITKATRSVELDGVVVEEGQIIGLLNGKLTTAGNDLLETLLGLLSQANVQEYELITLYYGADLNARSANRLGDELRQRFANQEVEIVSGGQPHYQLIFSVE
jgi:DAK2 domain fusion protein YloV